MGNVIQRISNSRGTFRLGQSGSHSGGKDGAGDKSVPSIKIDEGDLANGEPEPNGISFFFSCTVLVFDKKIKTSNSYNYISFLLQAAKSTRQQRGEKVFSLKPTTQKKTNKMRNR